MALDSIPNEILKEMFSHLPRRCLLYCSLVCHRWHDLSQTILYKRVSLVSYSNCIYRFLHTICTPSHKILATYVRNLKLGWVRSSPDPSWSVLLDPEDLVIFTTIAAGLGLDYTLGTPCEQVIVLLHLLPRVHSLIMYLPNDEDDDEILLDAMNHTTNLPLALRAVRMITVSVSRSIYGVTPPILLALLRLPQITSLKTGLVQEIEDPFPVLHHSTSTVTKLEMEFSCSYSTLLHMLQMPKALTHLSYRRSDLETDLTPEMLGSALKPVRSSLEHLDIDFEDPVIEDMEPSHAQIGSLRLWPALRSLKCPLALLLGSGLPENSLRLVGAVPPNIRDLHIVPSPLWSDEEMVRQVVELLHGKKHVAPALQVLTISSVARLKGRHVETLKAVCEAVVVKLVMEPMQD